MKALVLGAGQMGRAIVYDLCSSGKVESTVVVDSDPANLGRCCPRVAQDRLEKRVVDATDRRKLRAVMEDRDVVFGALPASFGLAPAKCAVKEGVNFVDIAFVSEDMMVLDGEAKAQGILLVPHCGFAPGMSNILVGYAVSQLDDVESARILAGGLPQKPQPPLDYFLTWSVDSLIDEYSRRCRVVRNGKHVVVDPLSGVETVQVPKVGELESFYTDGLSTLPDTFKDVPFMEEKTLRYPGHTAKMKTLSELGFFSDKPVAVSGANVVPRKVTAALLASKLRAETMLDVVILLVYVSGTKDRRSLRYEFNLIDSFDEESGITAMGRTTGYTASIVGQMIGGGMIDDAGVFPPERIGLNPQLYGRFGEELAKRSIKLELKVAS